MRITILVPLSSTVSYSSSADILLNVQLPPFPPTPSKQKGNSRVVKFRVGGNCAKVPSETVLYCDNVTCKSDAEKGHISCDELCRPSVGCTMLQCMDYVGMWYSSGPASASCELLEYLVPRHTATVVNTSSLEATLKFLIWTVCS